MLPLVPKRETKSEQNPTDQIHFKGYTLNPFQVEAAKAI